MTMHEVDHLPVAATPLRLDWDEINEIKKLIETLNELKTDLSVIGIDFVTLVNFDGESVGKIVFESGHGFEFEVRR